MRIKFGENVLRWICFTAILTCQSSRASSLYCDKIFTYYEEYGQNSFNVTCSGITKGKEHILENIMINNEISLTIIDSVLENLTPNIFKNVRSIKMLNIINCTFEFNQKMAIFNQLGRLESLVIENTRFKIDNVTLKSLKKLKSLRLTNNSLSGVDRDGFTDLINLEKLEIVDNHVNNLEDLQLCELQKLKTLVLRQNLLANINFFCSKNNKNLDVNINDVPAMPSMYQSYFLNVTTISYDLIYVDLSFNQIPDVGYSLEGFSKLRFINLGFNRLVEIKYAQFRTLNKLEKLILKYNRIGTFETEVLENKTRLNFLDLSYNQLQDFHAANSKSIQTIDLSFNNLTSIGLSNLTALKDVNLESNNLKNFESSAFYNIPKLFSLNLAGNNLHLTQGFFKEVHGLKVLRLSNNSLTDVPEKVFLGLKNLRVLDLSDNKLSSLNENTFHDLDNLEVLNLSSNSLGSLAYLSVEPLKNLRVLDVADNKLQYVEYDVILSNLPGLMNINIKANLLTCGNLDKIIAYLKQRHIGYTNSERMDLASIDQNVAGIPCRSANGNVLLASLQSGGGSEPMVILGIGVLTVLIGILTGIVSYKFWVYLKRRKYRADEFELVDE